MKERILKVITLLIFSSLLFACSDDEPIYDDNWVIDNSKEDWEEQIVDGSAELWKTGLPVIVINTPDGVPVKYKTTWVEGATFECFNPDSTLNSSATTRIRLHGNSSRACPKVSYNLDFDEKCSVLSMPPHKRWILIANHFDKTLLRNTIGQWMGRKFGSFAYNPRNQFVEVILNGKHLGTYMLIEHIRQSDNRVENGYVIEFDDKYAEDDIVFQSVVRENDTINVNIKDPDIEMDGEEFNHIKELINNLSATLYGKDPFNKTTGYFHVADRETFADFYIVNEISKNVDARFYSSCFANLTTYDRLYMGPLWDFDVGFGNYVFENPYTINEPTGLYMHKCPWIEIMLKENEFLKIVSKKLKRYYNHEAEIMAYIDEQANSILNSIVLNERLWNVLTKDSSNLSDQEIKDLYLKQVEWLKNWIHERFIYLKTKY
ncbi:MAG: hypothetical protein E7071_05630 [Bacteroidales bacterium]|nr:hypothetical protein [Bacteroidales bacterium]